MTLAHIEVAIAQRVAQKKRYPVDAKAPQKQCKFPRPHTSHHFEGRYGLIWSCQGRGPRGEASRLATAPRSNRDEA